MLATLPPHVLQVSPPFYIVVAKSFIYCLFSFLIEFRQTQEFLDEFWMYHYAVHAFSNGLPPIQPDLSVDNEVVTIPAPPLNIMLVLAHTFAHVALIHLYGAVDLEDVRYEQVYSMRLTAAKKACGLVRVINNAGVSTTTMPIMMGVSYQGLYAAIDD